MQRREGSWRSSNEGRLRELQGLTLEKSRIGEEPSHSLQLPGRRLELVQLRLYSQGTRDRTRRNGLKLYQEWF